MKLAILLTRKSQLADYQGTIRTVAARTSYGNAVAYPAAHRGSFDKRSSGAAMLPTAARATARVAEHGRSFRYAALRFRWSWRVV